MAKSGTFTTTIANGLYLDLEWREIDQDIGGNRTKVRLTLKLRAKYTVIFSANKPYKIQGSSYTYTGGFRGTGTKTIGSRDIWVNHNSDGKKTQNFHAELSINITYSGSYKGTYKVSGNATLTAIPRKSELTRASIGTIKPGSTATLSLSIDRKYSGFNHLVSILDGTKWIKDWGYGTGTPTSLTIDTSAVDRMLNAMPNSTSKTFRVRVRTYSGSNGSGYIGESFRNVTVSVDSSVKPKILSTGYEIHGSGWDKQNNMFIQNHSRVRAWFSSKATGGANVSSRKITVASTAGKGSSSGGSVVGGVFEYTNGRFGASGEHKITYTITDSRGRSTSSSTTISVASYNPPKIDEFTVTRRSGNQSTVDITRRGTTTSLSGKNTATLKIDKRETGGSWTNVQNVTFTGNFGDTISTSNIDTTKSYEFRIEVTDSLGNKATADATEATARVLMDWHKDLGMGIGKMHENGALDVGGEAYFDGPIYDRHGTDITDPTYLKTVDLSDLDDNTWYPVVGSVIDKVKRIVEVGVYVMLNTNKPSWSTHKNGFSAVVHARVLRNGWGETAGTQYILVDDQSWYDGDPPVSVNQMTTASRPVLWLRGGGTYRVYDTYNADWDIKTSSYTHNNTTVSPRSSPPPHRVKSHPVVQTGSNSNGHYMRFYDGTQICWLTGRVALSGDVRGTFPLAFKDEEVALSVGGSSGGYRQIRNISLVGASVSGPDSYRIMRTTNHEWTHTDVDLHYSIIAIGKWF